MRYLPIALAVLLGAGLILPAGCSRFPANTPSEPITPAKALRRPVAMRFVDDGKLLLIVNQRSGKNNVQLNRMDELNRLQREWMDALYLEYEVRPNEPWQ